MSTASESQWQWLAALDVVTATSNEFVSPVIRSPLNHSQKPLLSRIDAKRPLGVSQ